MFLPLEQGHQGGDVELGKAAVVDGPRAGRIAQPVAGQWRQQLPDLAANLSRAILQVLAVVEQRDHPSKFSAHMRCHCSAVALIGLSARHSASLPRSSMQTSRCS